MNKECFPAALLFGSDLYWRDRCRRQVIESWIPGERNPWAVVRLSLQDTEVESVLGQAQTLPLLTGRQVVIADSADALDHGTERGRPSPIDSLARYLEAPAPFTFLLFETEKVDKRAKLYRLFNEKAVVVELDFGTQADPATVSRMARALGCDIEPSASELLCALCGDDLGRMQMELEKLQNYVGDRKHIGHSDVRVLVVPSSASSVWELAEVLGRGLPRRALEITDKLLRDGENATKLVGALAWTYRKLIEAQELPQTVSAWQAAQRLGVRPESAGQMLRQARRSSSADLRAGLVALAEADKRLKSGAGEERAVMEFLVVRLVSLAAPRAAATGGSH